MQWLRKNAWLLLFGVGLVLLFYAYDNIVVIPSLAVDDPERGWAWLTRDPEVLDYIKWWFRTFGFWVLAVAIFVLVISATGYRHGQKWAFYSLLYLPVHIIVHMVIWPWLIPVLVAMFIVTIAGLILPFGEFFSREQP